MSRTYDAGDMARMKSHTATKAPNGLDKVLNQPEEQPRDSGFFATDSKHTSMNSTNALTPSSGGYQSSPAEGNTPSPVAITNDNGGQPLASPMSAMSVASMVSPTTAEHGIPTRNSAGYTNGDSRRESVSSSMYHNLGELRINGGASPFASQNPSSTSLQETLQQQRNPGERPTYTRFSNSYQPSTVRAPAEAYGGSNGKKAPAITGPAPGSIARAAEATKGQAWAFPEVEVQVQQRMPAARPSAEAASQVYESSRRSSMASIASSQFTTESRYPSSQRRLEDGMPAGEFNRLSRASSEFQGAGQTHHHHQLTRLQSEEASSPTGSAQPYSRTPELRVTHKLAERKRRTEMKELFERLAAKLPSDGRSTKSSKWETLSKACTEIDRMQAVNSSLQSQMVALQQHCQHRDMQLSQVDAVSKEHAMAKGELNDLKHEAGGLQHENANLKHEIAALRAALSNAGVNPPAPGLPMQWGPPQTNGHERQELPPIRSLPQVSNFTSTSQAMTGVEYPSQAIPSTGFGDRRPY
ncbi:hypothetical protein BP6252_01969 [Coleophoma cylindrospora]|uniref:BHLH domain-containing protein n=1 Tax=Coleophoma cylindrospora TaxID=1849047 RepID=A0A3D8SDI8_9HELO|nr:hypothetical protein BP6252_01969 [Coleophoma cylindrospora]